MAQGRLERWLLERWYGPEPITWLRPLEAVFRLITGLRRWLYALGVFKVRSPGVPVLVVGNLTTGGTGKTPLVLYLVELLKQRGVRVGIVSRGYGGTGGLQLVTAQSTASQVGDEPVLLARRSGVPVCVGRNRLAAAQVLVRHGIQCIISDDGLQHYALGRQLQIAVVDGQRGLGNGACLPAGPLREPVWRFSEMDMIVVNGGPAEDFPAAVTMRLQADGVLPVVGSAPPRTLRSFAGQTVHALAGIGNPERFFDSLRQQGITVLSSALGDHARISADDLAFGDQHEILMTEKDAVKCTEFAGPDAWYVPIAAHFDESDQARLEKLLDELISHILRG